MIGLGLLGDERKPTTVVRASIGGKEKSYSMGDDDDEKDMFNPIEYMMEEFIKAVHDKKASAAAEILCSIMKIERLKSGTSIEIKG